MIWEPNQGLCVSAIALDDEVSTMNSDEGQTKAKAIAVSGIPLPGTLVQVPGTAVVPNRDEPDEPFKVDGTGEQYARDYFDDESDRLGGLEDSYVPATRGKVWSPSLDDEENTDPNAAESNDSEVFLPEAKSLEVDNEVRFGMEDDEELALRTDKFDDSSI